MKKIFSTKFSQNAVNLSLLALRLTMGGLIISHGYSKLVKFSAMSNRFADPFHIGNTASLGLVVFAEFFCGILVLIGLMTRLATIPLIITMIVALMFAHNWQMVGEGEKATLYLAGFIAILLMGPGKLSMDKLIGK